MQTVDSVKLDSPRWHFPLHLQVPPCPHSEALFAQAWNKIIDDLRERDLINNLEKEHLTYVEVSPASETHGGWWLLPM